MVGAVARAAFPAGGVGETPWLVGPEALVGARDLAGGLGDPCQHRPQLSDAPARDDEAGAHLFAPGAGLADLREAELVRAVAREPAAGQVQAGLRVAVGLGL